MATKTETYRVTLIMDEELPYAVVADDGEIADQFETLGEAKTECRRRNAQAREEAEEAEADTLRGEIELALQYAPLAELREIAKVVLAARGI